LRAQGKLHGVGDDRGLERDSGTAVVNVNNRLVPESTKLIDGDMVVLSREILQI
jgi:molybdopterin converting factor small subunit